MTFDDLLSFNWSLPFDATTIAGMTLWSLALYLGFSPASDWTIDALQRWFNFAERSLYTSEEEFEQTRPARESQNAFYASILSVIPFLVVGGLCNWLVEVGLGRSWTVSLGLIMTVGGGLYELGRRAGSEDS